MPIDELEPVVEFWWKQALHVIRTKSWFETWAAFIRAYGRVEHPLGAAWDMQEVLLRARQRGVPPRLPATYHEGIAWLAAAICRELSLRSEDGKFFLATETLGRLIETGTSKAAACLRALTGSRVIAVVTEESPGRVREYVYLLPREDVDTSDPTEVNNENQAHGMSQIRTTVPAAQTATEREY